jgi:hypothetical protein
VKRAWQHLHYVNDEREELKEKEEEKDNDKERQTG